MSTSKPATEPVLDPRVDAYIDRAAPFAQPLLRHWRALMHATCPEAAETIKWGVPHFVHSGKLLCGMAAFKGHCAISFWQGDAAVGESAKDGAMGQLGRLTDLKDLPSKHEQQAMIRRAKALIDAGVVPARKLKPATPRPAPETPDDLAAALAANPAARASFDGFPPGQRREYLDWITEAKRPETRAKRLAQAVEWMAEGKRRNWKYENC